MEIAFIGGAGGSLLSVQYLAALYDVRCGLRLC
jgi:hypothetical protein